jgi:hypothetical protein
MLPAASPFDFLHLLTTIGLTIGILILGITLIAVNIWAARKLGKMVRKIRQRTIERASGIVKPLGKLLQFRPRK